MKLANEMNALEIIAEVAEAEKNNQCADRARLQSLNMRLMQLTGKTAAMLLTELGM